MRVTFARQTQPSRGIRSWWGKAWQRAVEEAAYSEAELRPGRAAARRGDVGGISVDSGSLLAAVREGTTRGPSRSPSRPSTTRPAPRWSR